MSTKPYCSKYAKTHINAISINHQNKIENINKQPKQSIVKTNPNNLLLKPIQTIYCSKYAKTHINAISINHQNKIENINKQPKQSIVKTNPNNLLLKSSL
jgi:hypothetical protein